MNAEAATAKVLETLAELQTDLSAAREGPMNPKLRSELARMAAATEKSLTQIGASQQAAMATFAAKQEKAAQLAALNQQLVAQKKAALAASQTKAKQAQPLPAIDPTLGQRLGEELLGRQQRDGSSDANASSLGLLDDWDLEEHALENREFQPPTASP